MKKVLAFSAALLIFTAACSSESHHTNKHTSKSSETQQEHSNNQASKDTRKQEKTYQNSDNPKRDNVNQLSEKKKAALVFSSNEASEYTLNKKEILTGIFEQNIGNKNEKKQLYKLFLIKTDGYKTAPRNMKFYTVYPPKGGFSSIIGIGKDKAFVGGTQGATTYKDLLENGKELDLKTLYEENKNFKSLDELAQKINFTNTNPMKNEKMRKEFQGNESATTMAHARSQVYQQINDFEGKPINTKDYIWDNVKWNNGINSWTVNYRNKNLELVGTYKKDKNHPITKLDSNGNKIK